MKRTSLLAAAAGAAVVLGLAGTALAASKDPGAPSVSFSASPSPSATDDDLRGDDSVDDNDDDGGLRGDGTVDDDGDDGGLRGDGTVDDDGASPSASPAAGAVSADRAVRIARQAAGGGLLVRVEAESEHGRAVWDVRIMVGSVRHDIDVDRATGAVTRHKADVKSNGTKSSNSDDKSGHGGDDEGGDDNGGHGSDD